MRLWTWILSCIVLCSCSVTHQLRIKKPPCLYPFVHYDFTLCEPFSYKIDGVTYSVPQGFTTNLASIPRILWSIYSPNEANTIPGAVIHDYLYFCPGEMTRLEVDDIFYDALIYKHVSVFTAFKYWLAVRIFGMSHFNRGAVCSFTVASVKNSMGDIRQREVEG